MEATTILTRGAHVATAPRQVWCWDMTYLPATVIGMWFHPYLILDPVSYTHLTLPTSDLV